MNTFKSIAWTGAIALLLSGFPGAMGTASKDNHNTDPKQISTLMLDAKTMALQARDDAATMAGYGHMDMKWGDHAKAVAQIRENVMGMDVQVAKLKAAEGNAEPWQKDVMQRIEPYLTQLAENNNSILAEMDTNPSVFGTAAWNAYLDENANSAAYFAGLIANFVNDGMRKMRDYDQPQDICQADRPRS
jgi:hypothetical protein